MRPDHRVRIHTEDDHERVTHRVDELANAAPGSREEAELMALLDALERWDAHRDDWSGWF
jgi:hypothetical protein